MSIFGKTRMMGVAMTLLVGAALGVSACSGGDEVANGGKTPCTFDSECTLGQVCLLKDGVCGAVECDFCLSNQICYTNTDGTQSCSRPECTMDSECEGELSCVDGVCGESTCQSREDCDAGKICNVIAGKCVEPPEECSTNFDCPSGEVCLESGSCRPGCASSEECAAGKVCDATDKLCVDGCRDSTECSAEQTCDASNSCTCDSSKCAEGFTCDEASNACVENPITSCADVTCGEGTRCNSETLECDAFCTADAGQVNSCLDGEFCNTSTGQCEVKSCVDKTPEECAMNPSAPYLSEVFCECVECVEDSQCSGGKTCNVDLGVCQAECQTSCDSAVPGSCDAAGNASYCYGGCCVECIGAADCGSGQICIDGFCGQPPSCDVDPTACPSGTTCVSGTCQTMAGGSSCDVADPTSCPFGQQCQPSSNTSTMGTCQGSMTPGTCGSCNADCTCDGGLTCNGFACEGCDAPFDTRCPGSSPFGGLCLAGICLDLGF